MFRKDWNRRPAINSEKKEYAAGTLIWIDDRQYNLEITGGWIYDYRRRGFG